ncbi:hypothetical protein [Caenispirillum bisanense]|uniref:hypothetical protein n=1 Tax=Caenispirillum bisanense TaxID=414052 RepID=UPI0031DDC518
MATRLIPSAGRRLAAAASVTAALMLPAAALAAAPAPAPAPAQAQAPAAAESPAAPAGLPAELMVKGAPIDPYCFEALPETFSPDACLDENMELHPDHPATGPDADGWLERTYRYTDMEEPMNTATAGYRVLGRTEAGMVVETRAWGGGTGQFSSIVVFRRDGDTVTVIDRPFGGDRCNGGIIEAGLADGVITASVAITPYDLLDIALHGAETSVAAYDDIAACAICCIGTADFRGDQLTGVTLGFDEEPASRFADEEGDGGPPMQKCFDDLVAARGAYETPGLTLDRAALDAFGTDFKARCLTPPKK